VSAATHSRVLMCSALLKFVFESYTHTHTHTHTPAHLKVGTYLAYKMSPVWIQGDRQSLEKPGRAKCSAPLFEPFTVFL
jgi:hypothetical protein